MAVSSCSFFRRLSRSPQAVPPPGPFLEEGLARSLPRETGGSTQIIDCFTTGDASAERRGSSRWGSAQGCMHTPQAKGSLHFQLLSRRASPHHPTTLPGTKFTLTRPFGSSQFRGTHHL